MPTWTGLHANWDNCAPTWTGFRANHMWLEPLPPLRVTITPREHRESFDPNSFLVRWGMGRSNFYLFGLFRDSTPSRRYFGKSRKNQGSPPSGGQNGPKRPKISLFPKISQNGWGFTPKGFWTKNAPGDPLITRKVRFRKKFGGPEKFGF